MKINLHNIGGYVVKNYLLETPPSRRMPVIYPAHGTPFPPKDLVKYRHFMDGRKLIPPT